MIVRGRFRNLTFYDVGEAFDREQLQTLMGPGSRARDTGFIHLTPDYVRFHSPPLLQAIPPVELSTGEKIDGSIKYYSYGVACVELGLNFACEWDCVREQAYRWMNAPEVDAAAGQLLRDRVQRLRLALIKPSPRWLDEDYFIVDIQEARKPDGTALTAAELMECYSDPLTQMVRGEASPLSRAERDEVLRSALSYYPNDLLVVGWAAAVVYDKPEAASSILDLLEYANTQLLEFRYYDELLTNLLSDVYSSLEGHGSFLARWRLPGEAGRVNRIRLDVMELVERTEYAVKFISDMYYARVYRLSSSKIGVDDYKALVNEKLKTAGELYEFMVNQFNEFRTFVLELIVAILVGLDVILLLHPKW